MQALSEIEQKTLKALIDGKQYTVEELEKKTGLPIDSVRRAMEWLKEKELVEVTEEKKESIQFTERGKNALEHELPEKRFVSALGKLKGKAAVAKVEESAKLGKELNFALGVCKKLNWITVETGNELMVSLTGLEKEPYALQKELHELNANRKAGDQAVKEFLQRGLIEKKKIVKKFAKINESGKTALGEMENAVGEINVLNAELIQSGEWKKRSFRKYNVFDPAPPLFAGKKQPYLQFLDQVKAKLTRMGFKEMNSPLIVPEFYNFDVLFQPQNHSARTWTDTYQLKQPKRGILPRKEIVEKVRSAHENGGKANSKGWRYDWSEEIAAKLMPAAHGTAHSARQMVEGIEVPGKYFSIARCYRPDVVDATHLSEFNQMEGFIADKNFTFQHLLGMLKQFATEIAGATQVKFLPDYYPFTEPSVQLSALHPTLGWVEFGGAGIFRPEITKNLGIDGTCLAWGLGVDRLAMFSLGINDIRELFSQDLDWLRKSRMV